MDLKNIFKAKIKAILLILESIYINNYNQTFNLFYSKLWIAGG